MRFVRHGRRQGIILLGIALAIALAGAGAVAAVYTERPEFCPTCHEMGPYYDAWRESSHGSVSCMACHVDPGVAAHGLHKFVALREVWHHFTRDNRFPNRGVDVPDARCTRCHKSVKVETKAASKFSHALHAEKGRCITCHATSGHEVTLDALSAANVLRAGAIEATRGAGRSVSVAVGHVAVVCQDCHDQAKMPCFACHSAPHEPRGDCSACHATGTKFVFRHPADTGCSKCHTAPAKHFEGACSLCHVAGSTFVFRHPASQACATCHKAPAKHYGSECSSCHKPSVAFASARFRHPTNSSCAKCHAAPKRHYGGSCSSCHTPGAPFASARFRHPRISGEHSYRSFACAKCHPRGYSSSSCTCHGGRPPEDDD